MADELRVDARLAHPSGDQLAVLATEVEYEDGSILRLRMRRRERDDLGVLGTNHAGSSGLLC